MVLVGGGYGRVLSCEYQRYRSHRKHRSLCILRTCNPCIIHNGKMESRGYGVMHSL